MTFTYPVLEASSHLAELVERARRSHERVVLTERGQPAAVLIAAATRTSWLGSSSLHHDELKLCYYHADHD